MVTKLCLLVPLELGEEVRQILIDQEHLDRAFTPRRIGDELALPLHDCTPLGKFVFEHRIEKVYVEPAPPAIDPHSRLYNSIASLSGVSDAMLQSIPKKWERLDDLILFPKDAFQQQGWESLILKYPEFFSTVAHALNAARIGRQHPIANDQMRSAQVELLYGENGWVEVKDNGLVYGFDATKVMYSSGNVTERHRMATLQAEGDIVIDAYAGIGYYTMQLLVHANVNHVHACEINPNSIHALEWSAKKNNVRSKLTVHSGDNQITLRELKGIADRVLLGYLPSSEPTWEPAIQSLKETGGTIHIHMNVEEEIIDAWCEATMDKCLQFASKAGRHWEVVSHHLEKVKWYAPRIRHVVLDVSFSSINSAS
ncbi:MAG: hypothetical protein VXW36_00625 [Candidatus Thermoplasmatota archaeon]|nr:hypothetical protein [Candidatus Thermoplasmatota archaeon]